MTGLNYSSVKVAEECSVSQSRKLADIRICDFSLEEKKKRQLADYTKNKHFAM